jgi:hypothetical protein
MQAVAEEKARVLTHGAGDGPLRAALPLLRGGQLGGDDREMLIHRQRGLELMFLKP